MSYLDNFEKYIRLYESGTSLSKLSLPTKDQSTLDTFQVFKSSKVDVRIVDRDKNLDLILGLVSISKILSHIQCMLWLNKAICLISAPARCYMWNLIYTI